ncbi:MAG TPA: thioredoxin family protein [Firmicutes bacterium]|nr:thioredoxin family protein [Bacillota bacterium]
MALEVNKDNYESEVLQANGLVLVDVWGPRCIPCMSLMPFVDTLQDKYPNLKVVKLDSSQNRRLCINHRIIALPTFILYQDGQEIERLSGDGVSPESITAMIEKAYA